MARKPTDESIDFGVDPTTNARRGVLNRASDPLTAAVLRIVTTFGGGGLAGGALFVWSQFIHPFIVETRDLLHRGLDRQEVLARHIDGLERRLGVAIPVGSDPAWLLLQAPAPSHSWLNATAEAATLPQGSGEAHPLGEVTDAGVDAASAPAGSAPVAGR